MKGRYVMKKTLKIAVNMLVSMPKTVYLNFKLFDVKTALRLPILVSWNTKLHVGGQSVEMSN